MFGLAAVYCSRSFSFVFRLYSSSYSSLPEMPRVALYIYSVVSFLYSSLRARCGRGWPLPHVPQKVPGPSGRLAAAVVLGQHLRVRWSRVPFLGPRSSSYTHLTLPTIYPVSILLLSVTVI